MSTDCDVGSAHECGSCMFSKRHGAVVIVACCRAHHTELRLWMDGVNDRDRIPVIMNEKPRPTTPEERVAALGDDIGYGCMMQLCEKLWNEKEFADGVTAGGAAHAVYCCGVFLVACPSRAHPTSCGVTCDWCCGAGRVTERVAQAIRESEGAV